MGTDQINADPERGLTKSAALATIRGILVSSLSRENLSPVDVEDFSSPDQIESPPVAPSRRRRKVTFFDSKPGENDENAGAAPVDSQRQTPRSTSAKQGLHWFGHGAEEFPLISSSRSFSGSSNWVASEAVNEVYDGSAPLDQGKDLAAQRDREERLRIVKERQNDERQRKLDELKQQALAAQKFREQKEEERRRRLEELRHRDSDRRHQVEERKRQIWEAERDRREAILRKNQEREARIESKRKNERSSIVFAFGSSTPRMLEPADTGGSYWATRRATSTSNVMMLSMSAAPGPLTRRSSERELDGSKKRATSAGGINRSKTEDGAPMSTSIYDVFQWDSSPKSSTPMSSVDVPPPLTNLAEIPKTGGDEGDGEGSGTVTPIAAAGTPSSRAARRKTDLMPTLPSPRDLTPGRGQSFRPTRSPGRAYSMSRLDILAQPRKLKIPAPPPPPHDASLSRSMTHLAQQPLRRADTSRSMSQLSAPPAPPPRPTRAERLRKKAREAGASRSPSAEQQSSSPGLRSGEVTPSRPQSSMSTHSVSSSIAMSTSVHSAIKSRPQAAPRRPRPYSIAVTGISAVSSTEPTRQSFSSEHRKSNTPSTGGTEKPPIPKVHATKKPIAPKPELPKKPTDKLTKSAKSSASPTPKATPLQSPGVEVVSSELNTCTAADEEIITTVRTVTTVTSGEEEETIETVHSEKVEVTVVSPSVEEDITPEVKREIVVQTTIKESTPLPVKEIQESVNDTPECDMTASMLAKTRITTEEEAKAALAERRRLAREQAEREAELERQRVEVERLAEEERLRKEEEEQRRMEVEQLRLLEEARHAEEERLRQAIEEASKREEEERRQREEDAKQKLEKEEAEKKAKEEAEKQRQEMEIRLKKEEEDRQARRKRVEAIMLRTRGKGTTPTNTPTKEDGDDSPSEESKQDVEHMNAEEKFLHSERSHSEANSTPITPKHNGHQNGVDNVIVEQNNVTNNLLDLSLESDGVSPLPQPLAEQILLPATTTPTNGKLANEDNVNFNTPPPSSPFIAFQDNKKQDAAVNDLLS